MKLKENDIDVLSIIVYNDGIHLSNISLYLNLSESTIRNSINNINSFFEHYNFKDGVSPSFLTDSLSLLSVKNGHCYANFDKNNSLELDLPDNKIDYILLKLLIFDFVNFEQIAEIFYLDRKSMDQDSKKINALLRPFHLKLLGHRGRGYFLQGSPRDKNIFFVSFLAKVLIKDHFYSNFIIHSNKVNNLLFSHIPQEDLKAIKSITQTLIETFEVSLGVYFDFVIEASLICSYLRRKNKDFPDLSQNPNFKKIYEKIETLNLNKKYIKYPTYYFLSIYLNKNTDIIIKRYNFISQQILSKYSIKLNSEARQKLDDLINRAFYKKIFNIRNFNKLPIKMTNFLKLLTKDLHIFFLNQKFDIFLEDTFLIIIFLYTVIRGTTINNLKDKNIAIVDTSSDLWFGKYIRSLFNDKSIFKVSIIPYSLIDKNKAIMDEANYLLIPNFSKLPSFEDKYYDKSKFLFRYEDLYNLEFFLEYIILTQLNLI